MDAFEICLTLAAFCIGLLAVAAFDTVNQFSRFKSVKLLFLVVLTSGVFVVATQIVGGQKFDEATLHSLREGKPRPWILVLSALVAGIGWAMAALFTKETVSRIVTLILLSATTCICAAGLIIAWDNAFDIERFQPSVIDPAFSIEELARTEQGPVRIALDESHQKLYFSTFATGISGVYSGSIYSIDISKNASSRQPVVAASSPLLYRPFGLTCQNGDLYVSRAGHAGDANHGQVQYENLGAITQLRDLNGDGQFEYFHDVITDIPAARGPDTMHQNNGLTFDTHGNMYVAIGSADDRSLDQHEWSGTILINRSGSNKTEVFARGLRNPFGISCGPAGTLFVTDNDCAQDPGDEINFVVRDGHYGHPYRIPKESKVTGFNDPILVGENSNFCGIAFVPDPDLPETSGIVYVCDRLTNSILKLVVDFRDNTCVVSSKSVFAKIPSPVDIVASSAGELFVSSLRKQKIYRIHLR